MDGEPAPAVDYDAELRRYEPVLDPAFGVGPRDHVVDVGCGTGRTTRHAARRAVAGSALGVDLSATAIAQAARSAGEAGIRNVAFACADVQTHPFPPARFDLAISRFGTMFFGDPVAAFTNLGRALRPAGRLVMAVWQAREDNEWQVAIDRALAGPDGIAAVDRTGPDAFSLGDPPTATAVLHAAGFADVTFTGVRRPVYFGPDVDAALAWVRHFTGTTRALDRGDRPAAERALHRLRRTLADHRRADGVWFGSSAWIVSARRRAAG